MVKIFEGDCHAVENEINDWIEVYKPAITDVKESVAHLEREHKAILVVMIFFEAQSETKKVEYRMFEGPAHG